MTRLWWNVDEEGSRYWPLSDEIWVGREDVKRGRAPASIAHELAHRREGIFSNILDEPPERSFWKELAVWESAMEKGLSPDELDEGFIEDALGSYLDAVRDKYGKDHLQYREAKAGYDRFVRRYL